MTAAPLRGALFAPPPPLAAVAIALLLLRAPSPAVGHGYLSSPRSRNFYAHDIIGTDECTSSAGCPPKEYCYHCLNANDGACGKSQTLSYETSSWLDKNHDPMPWRSQGPNGTLATGDGYYVEGGTMVVDSYIDTHRGGHMEIRACMMDDANSTRCATPADFEGNELHFIEDLVHPDVPAGSHPPMYLDPNHPERGMYAGGQGGSVKSFSFLYRLPDGISGEKVLLQWKYITANSCSPPGYAEYFANHTDLPESYWTPSLLECNPPYPDDGTRSTTWPEQFFNCAEVSILPARTPPPTALAKPSPVLTAVSPSVSFGPTSLPTAVSPTVSEGPTSVPTALSPSVSEGPTPGLSTSSPSISEGPTPGPSTSSPSVLEEPTPGPPMASPSLSEIPTPGPTTTASPSLLEGVTPPAISGAAHDLSICIAEWADCSYNRHNCCEGLRCVQVDKAGYGRCLADTCPNTCVTALPTRKPTANPPTPGEGCCTVNLKACHHEEGSFCDSKSTCENECGKIWLPVGSLRGCLALWEQGCVTDGDCCQHGQCRNGYCESDDPWLKDGAPTTSSPTTNGPTSSPTFTPTNPFPTKAPTPQPTNMAAFNATYSDKVRVNQVGYLRFATKVGVIVDASTIPIKWQVQDALGAVVSNGSTSVYGMDGASGDHVHHADISSLQELGAYKLVVDGIGASLEFLIAPSLYPNLPHEAMNYFYFHRMGQEILGQHLIDDRYTRAALHPEDNAVPPYPGWCEGCDDFDLLGSWADAGDFGIYTVNHAISAWTLLNLHELFPEAFGDGTLNLPESGNSYPDVLDEVDFGTRFVRGMLPSNGGLASHKAHNHAWSAFTITIEAENAENAAGTRSAMGSSTPATYAVARVNAQLARVWHAKGGNPSYISELWNAAVDAWERADGTSKSYNPNEASPGSAVGGGDYPDTQHSDDRYAAACELYLTAYALGDTSKVTYKDIVMNSLHFTSMEQWDWATVAGAGTLSLYTVDNDLDPSSKMWIGINIKNFADKIVLAIDSEGYPSNLNYPSEFGQYPWGSNSFIMNRMIALAYAYEITEDSTYHKYLLRSMDYIMGTNAMGISFITGYGSKAETDTHDRWAWTIGRDAFWPRGWLSGGPNNELINDYETPGGVAPAKSYAGPGTAPHAWGSKENTVNWNAPTAWVAWYIENKVVPTLGGCGGICVPLVDPLSAKVQEDASISLTLEASHYHGTVNSWEIVDLPMHGSLEGAPPDLVYTPHTGYVGTDTFTYMMNDGRGASSAASATLSVEQTTKEPTENPTEKPFEHTSTNPTNQPTHFPTTYQPTSGPNSGGG